MVLTFLEKKASNRLFLFVRQKFARARNTRLRCWVVKKSVDKSNQRCYNKYVPKREHRKTKAQKKLKKVKKTLDKQLRKWYNKDVPKRNRKILERHR